MEPIRVLQVVGRMHRAGLETFLMNIYRNIDREKIQFDFLTHYTKEGDYDQEIESLGGKIYRFSVMEDKNILLYFKQLDDFFKAHNEYKIVHGHWTTFGLFYMYYAKKNGIKYRIAHAHSNRSKPGLRGILVNNLAKSMKSMSNYYFGCSQSAIEWLYGKNSRVVKNGKAKIIKNGIDVDKLKFNLKVRDEYRKNYNIEDRFVIGHIGRFYYPKNQDFIIRLFRQLYKNDSNSLLMLIGTGEDMERIEKEVKLMGLENSVMFLGNRSDIAELLSSMDIFLFPSRYEAFGMAAIEAQASGLTTIVSDGVPNDVHITNVITDLSLSCPIEKWVERILQAKNNHLADRIRTYEDVRASGYDIKEQVKNIKDFYLTLN
ncbi:MULTISPECIES: glycosyltransferase family 1 protein [unclassified Oceanobacillus]|uniref:glycosyltransferase family 1 protein n=1 Tax=unclassified Oceanobacillus TaxID=2630292 RepID=UPI00300E45CA